MKKALRKVINSNVFQTILSSLICIILGLLIGYFVLLFINPKGAKDGILDLIRNFLNYPNEKIALKYFGNTLVKTAPLIMCSLSILFCYKVGLFNIGVAGQYTIGAGVSLYAALGLGLPWWMCMILAMLGGALSGCISGALKAYCNVNEVISGIMLNWISLYCVNMLLTTVKEGASPYTLVLEYTNIGAIIPSFGLNKLFSNNKYVTIAIVLAILISFIVWIVLEKTRFGYELKATGYNKYAARYCGMAEKRNLILTLTIGGALAGLGASMLYLTGYEQWQCSQSSVPAMGFNGIAAAFLGGLNPIGTLFSSYFIQHITVGGAYVDKTMYSSQISDLISSIIIYLCGFTFFMKYLMNSRSRKNFDKKSKKLESTQICAGEAGADLQENDKDGGNK